MAPFSVTSNTVTLPITGEVDSDAFRAALKQAKQAIKDFQPELILVSVNLNTPLRYEHGTTSAASSVHCLTDEAVGRSAPLPHARRSAWPC